MIFVEIIAVLFNIHLYFLNGNEYKINGTIFVDCFESPIFPLWEQIHFYIYSVGPFFVILCFNIHLLRIAFRVSKLKRKRLSKISINVILQSFVFLLMTTPSSFVSAYFYQDFINTNKGKVIIYLSDNILFTYNSINLFSMMITNNQFYTECKIIAGIKIQPETQVKVITTRIKGRRNINRSSSGFSYGSESDIATSVF